MDQLLKLLRDGNIDQFNSERPFELNFFAEDLSGLALQGVDLSGANLEKADLSDSNLEDANLSKAKLSGADLTNTNMNRCNLFRAKLNELYAETSSFEEADMRQTSMNEAEFHSCSFVGAQLMEAKGYGIVWNDNKGDFIDLSNAKFKEGAFTKSSFTQGTLDGLRIPNSSVEDCHFHQVSMHKSLVASCTIKQCTFEESNLSLSNWNETTIEGTSFSFCNLTRADFTGMDIGKLSLTECDQTDMHADLGQKPYFDVPEPKHLFIEMPWTAIQNNILFTCWINPETDGSIIRFIIFDLKKGSTLHIGSIPTAPSLLRGAQVVATPEGFVFLCFENRPSNTYAIFYRITNKGTCTRFGQIPLTYTVDFQTRHFFPMYAMRYTNGHIELYILGRNAPRLHVHQLKFTGEFNEHAYAIPTAEGLLQGETIFVSTKGGAVCSLSARGTEDILEPPKGFPGRSFSTDTHKDSLIAGWLAAGEQGIPPQKGVFASGFEDNAGILRFHNRETVQSCCIIHDGTDIWLAYTIAPSFEATEVWISQASGTAQYNIPMEEIEDEIDTVLLRKSDGKAYLIVSLINGTLQVFQLSPTKAIALGTVSQFS